ncbi:hypothetical protein DFH08DRAFT_395654 [Mycena albidolilacea]|uniref:Uncharacterized protein n=1 Tax=Mycena albidolilacea TaxID=1033008 RepID=A0AAD7EG29_9AGAR|nr:hypothetical protein DFH08DRAFT_395654 [Mycena albidolilacea]
MDQSLQCRPYASRLSNLTRRRSEEPTVPTGLWYTLAVQRRVLDVGLVHMFMYETVVCCIQFSADAKYPATGCNRTAQIDEMTRWGDV